MQVWEVVLIVAAISGLLIAAGGIALLWKGAITLESASKEGNLTIDVANKVKLSSSYPGIALFLVGLCFFALPLVFLHFFDPSKFASKADYYSIASHVKASGGQSGRLDTIRVRVGGGISDINVTAQGVVSGTFVLPRSLDNAFVWVVAPGYANGNSIVPARVNQDKIEFDEIDLGERLLDTPAVREEEVAPEDAIIKDRSRLPQALF